MSSEPESQPLTLGSIVMDRYRVVEHVAAGGHSVVYRGQDERLSRPVCIKVFSRLPAEHGVSRASYEHFVQEAFALSRLTHPNTLRIYDFGHITVERDEKKGDVPFQVCEYMNGGTLAQLVRDQGPQTPAETLRIIGAMCDALAEAHALGIVHRDIKPQNILFGTVGATRLPKLADFGIAKWTDQDEPSGNEKDKEKRAGDTQIVAGAKMAMYSPSWAAPEQLSGQKVGPTTDIYSLAVVAVYALTGNPIFACDDVYEGYRKRRQPARLVREAFEPFTVPPEAIDALSHALAFSPQDRPARISDMIGALQDAFEPSTVELERLPSRARDRATHSAPTQSITPRAFPPPTPLVATSPRGDASPPLGEAAAGTPRGRAAAELGRDPSPQVAPLVHLNPPGSRLGTPPPPLAGRETPSGGVPMPFHGPNTPPGGVPAPLPPVPGGPPRRVQVSPTPIAVADRMAHFAEVTQGAADVADVAAGVRVRVTIMPPVGGRRSIHLKSLSSFIAMAGGRPTSAIQLSGDGEFELVSGGQQVLAKGRLSLGGPAAGHTVFQVGHETVALGLDECPEVVLVDFGPGRACHFVYTPGPGLRRPAGKRGQHRTNR